jgi:hypothetical protein
MYHSLESTVFLLGNFLYLSMKSVFLNVLSCCMLYNKYMHTEVLTHAHTHKIDLHLHSPNNPPPIHTLILTLTYIRVLMHS